MSRRALAGAIVTAMGCLASTAPSASATQPSVVIAPVLPWRTTIATRSFTAPPSADSQVAAMPAGSGVAWAARTGADPAVDAGPGGTVQGPRPRPAPERWQPPLVAVRLIRPFDAPAGPYAAGHRGADLGATVGQQVRAPVAGVVVFAGMVAGRPVLTLRHTGTAFDTTYEPVQAAVPVGAAVAAGAVIGTLVNSAAGHCQPTSCLHWGARLSGTYVDPMLMLGRPRIVLKTPRP